MRDVTLEATPIQWRRSCGGPGVLTPTFWQWGVQMYADPSLFTAVLLYVHWL